LIKGYISVETLQPWPSKTEYVAKISKKQAVEKESKSRENGGN
jgi:hypothetical protein